MKHCSRIFLAAVLILISVFSVLSPLGLAACKHERACNSSSCTHCGSAYTGSNIYHDYSSTYYHPESTYHLVICLGCSTTIAKEDHYTLCCSYLMGDRECFACSASYSPIYIEHHMLYEDDGTPVDCCSFFPDNSTLPGNSSSGNNAGAAKNYRTDYLYKNSTPLFDTVLFGAFEQDNNQANGKEPIEWYILYSDNEKALLVSRFGLTNANFNKTFQDVTWETSTIRTWLNGAFYNTAFLDSEKYIILTNRKSSNDSVCEYGKIATSDKVFLLSLDEVNYYMDTVLRRQLIATPYAKANGIQVINNYSWWWLRTNGNSHKTAQIVFETGYISTIGRDVSSYVGGVRPAIWIDASLLR